MTILRKHGKMLLWAAAALACVVVLSVQTQAAEFRMGPGDHYDAQGNIVAFDGTVLVTADGTVIKEPFANSTDSTAASGVKQSASGTSAGSGSRSAGSSAVSGTSITDRPAHVPNYTVSGSGASARYTFEGKTYVKDSSYGTHKLTGYAAEETGTAGTYSGKTARAGHTAAAPSDLPIGTVIIVEGVSGPYASEFDGVYVVEDRGGAALESQGLIDLFFDSNAEAWHVTDAGWNYADIWIAKAAD